MSLIETGESFTIDTSDSDFRREYKQEALNRIKGRERLFYSTNVDNIDIYTDTPYTKELIKFFKMRERRLS